jgi:hypothetical protein
MINHNQLTEALKMLTSKKIEERLNATLYLALHVPADRLDQGHFRGTARCIEGWCNESKWHTKERYTGFMFFHGLTGKETYAIVLDNMHLKGEAARADIVKKLVKALEDRGLEVYT